MSVYMHLFHGRTAPDEDMDDWGFDGPVLGPFVYLHTTYASDIKFKMRADHFAKHFPNEPIDSFADNVGGETGLYVESHISLTEDLVPYQGKLYGDWSIFTRDTGDADNLSFIEDQKP